MPDEKRARLDFSLGQPFLEPVPGAIRFDVDAREPGTVYAHRAITEFPGATSLDLVASDNVVVPGGLFCIPGGDPPLVFVAHRFAMAPHDARDPHHFGALEVNRFRLVVGTKVYAQGSWDLAALGLVYRGGLCLAPLLHFYLEATVSQTLPSPVRFYLVGEWGREVA